MSVVTVDWGTKVISIPQLYLTFDSGSRYTMDVDQFRKDLNALQDDEAGIVHEVTHIHNTQVVLGDLTLARVVEFINSYTITFEDGSYYVDLYGANNNVMDVVNHNQVSVRSKNSAGLILGTANITQTDLNSIADAVLDEIMTGHTTTNSLGAAINFLIAVQEGRWKIDTTANTLTLWDSSSSIVKVFDLKDSGGSPASESVYERVPQ